MSARRLLCLCAGAVLAILAAGLGCTKTQGTAPAAPEGRFEVTTQGAMRDTLRGRATYRLADSLLAGIELDVDSVQGLSVELEPRPLALRTYEVVDAELLGVSRGDSLPGLNAFLVTQAGDFHATAGSLDVTYLTNGELGATVSMQMRGTFDGVPGAAPSLTLTGTIHAVRRPR